MRSAPCAVIHRWNRSDTRPRLLPGQSGSRDTDEASGIPYTIIGPPQFLEVLDAIADASTDGSVIRLAPGLFQPIAADDTSGVVAEVALVTPQTRIFEIAGPEGAPSTKIAARYLEAVVGTKKSRSRLCIRRGSVASKSG